MDCVPLLYFYFLPNVSWTLDDGAESRRMEGAQVHMQQGDVKVNWRVNHDSNR
jgi:hypothetical protein